MPSSSAIIGLFITLVSDAFSIALFAFALQRKLYRKSAFFTAYILLLVPREFAWLWISNTSLLRTTPAFYFYWITDIFLSILRLATILEICWCALRNYPAVWSVARRILTSIGIILLLWTGNSALHNTRWIKYFISMSMQRFEFMQAALLLILLIIGVYYRIHIPALYRLVLIGICIYSAVQVANYEWGRFTTEPMNPVFDLLRRIPFIAAEAIWAWAVWRWGDVPVQPPDLIPQAVYDEHSPVIHDRLRDLNDRLARLRHL
jgi:hypothetical protein